MKGIHFIAYILETVAKRGFFAENLRASFWIQLEREFSHPASLAEICLGHLLQWLDFQKVYTPEI